MKNKRSVDVSTQVGYEKAVEDEEDVKEEEEYTEMNNEMLFYLNTDPTYEIWAVDRWHENSRGKIVGHADIYYINPITHLWYNSVQECLDGWSEQDGMSTEKWKTLCHRIEKLANLEEIIQNGNEIGV